MESTGGSTATGVPIRALLAPFDIARWPLGGRQNGGQEVRIISCPLPAAEVAYFFVMSKRHSYRSKHRMRSHDDAHAQVPGDGERSASLVLNHPLVPQNEPELITTRDELLRLIERLRATVETPSFAYDSEFIGEETYHPRLCVVQVATAEQVALVDALALSSDDLVPFWELLANSSVEKVVHAGQQDLEPVVRHLDRPPANIFDVQVAAGFIRMPYPASLGRLIAALVDPAVANCVGAKFSQWDRRPLTPIQIHYAANDVRYLPLLRRIMGEMLETSGNADFAAREFEELCDPDLYRFDATSQRLRIRGAERLGPAQKAALRALLAWRNEEARNRDVPPRSFVADGVIFEIARSLITDVWDLRHVRGLPRPVKRHGATLLTSLVRDAIDECDESDGGRPMRIDFDRERECVDALWQAMRERAHQRGVDPALVTSKRELTAFVRSRNANSGRAPDLRLIRPGGWRAELLADLLVEGGSGAQC